MRRAVWAEVEANSARIQQETTRIRNVMQENKYLKIIGLEQIKAAGRIGHLRPSWFNE